jgi:plastocyanin
VLGGRSSRITIADYAFAPAALTVTAGTEIIVTNHDQTAHTATSSTSGVFDTGTLKPGASRTVVLTKPGTYTYFCQFHAFMRATIVVASRP